MMTGSSANTGGLARRFRTWAMLSVGLALVLAGFVVAGCAEEFASDAFRAATAELGEEVDGTLSVVVRLPVHPVGERAPRLHFRVDGRDVRVEAEGYFPERALHYPLRVSADRVRSVHLVPRDESSPFREVPLVDGTVGRLEMGQTLVSGERVTIPQPPAAPSTESLEAALEGECGACHGEGAGGELVSLRLEDLRWAASRRDPGRYLVHPGRPERSLLLHVLIDGYPDRGGVQMPPPWAARELDGDVRRELVRDLAAWIRDGAPVERASETR